jgi:hypothetical protein
MELCVSGLFQEFFPGIVSGSSNLEHQNSWGMNYAVAVHNTEFVFRKINKNLENRMNKLKGNK